MVKYLLVKFGRTQTQFPDSSSKTEYSFPKGYDENKVIQLAIESLTEIDKVKSRGNTDEYCLVIGRDEDVKELIKNKDVKEITRDEFLAYGNKWVKPRPIVKDSFRVSELLHKQSKGNELTQEEKNALDPESPESGMSMTKTFSEFLAEAERKLNG